MGDGDIDLDPFFEDDPYEEWVERERDIWANSPFHQAEEEREDTADLYRDNPSFGVF